MEFNGNSPGLLEMVNLKSLNTLTVFYLTKMSYIYALKLKRSGLNHLLHRYTFLRLEAVIQCILLMNAKALFKKLNGKPQSPLMLLFLPSSLTLGVFSSTSSALSTNPN